MLLADRREPERRPLGTICSSASLTEKQQIAIARTLMMFGADPNLELGDRPLVSALGYLRTGLVELLLDWGAECSNLKDVLSKADHANVYCGNCKLFTLLAARGAEIICPAVCR